MRMWTIASNKSQGSLFRCANSPNVLPSASSSIPCPPSERHVDMAIKLSLPSNVSKMFSRDQMRPHYHLLSFFAFLWGRRGKMLVFKKPPVASWQFKNLIYDLEFEAFGVTLKEPRGSAKGREKRGSLVYQDSLQTQIHTQTPTSRQADRQTEGL